METVILPHADYSPQWEELAPRLVDIPGDVAEFGVYNGGGSRALSRIFPERTIWAFDTYRGIPGKDHLPNLDIDAPGDFKATYTFTDMFGEYPNVIPVMGAFADTLPMLPMRPKVAFAYLDADLYNSTKDVLWWLPGHLSEGGLLFLDDYQTHKGVRMAIDEFVAIHAVPFDGQHLIEWLPNAAKSGQAGDRPAEGQR